MLLYLAVVVSALTAAVLLALLALHRLTRPCVSLTGEHVDDYPGMLLDPNDVGARVTSLGVLSPFPLRWTDARYTIELPDARLALEDGSHIEAVSALRAAGVDDATWMLTYTTPEAVISPAPFPVFVLTLPLVRRLARCEVTVVLRDPLGRTVTRTIPALPKQSIGRPVTAAERRAGRGDMTA